MVAKAALRGLKYFCAYLLLCVATFLMLSIIIKHTSFDPQAGFLKVKQAYIHMPVWRTAFYIHVFTSIITLLAGFTQFSRDLLGKNKGIHRTVGKIYIVSVLFINVPSAMIMAVYANGLLPSRIAFTILDSLWFWFTLKAFLEIKRGNVDAHKRFMLRSYALTFSAITLRTWKLVLSHTTDLDPLTLYMIDAWLGFVPNLIFAEMLIWLQRKKPIAQKEYLSP